MRTYDDHDAIAFDSGGDGPMIWLVAFSLSPTHGSEAAVGWQWYERLSARGPVTVIAHRVFDTLGWVPEPLRADIVWLDTAPPVPSAVNRRGHLFRFWRLARAHLRAAATADDTLVIATQAAIWFHPWLGRPIPRARTYYGPIGPELMEWDPQMGVRAKLAVAGRNVATVASAALWRLGAARLPANMALRFDAPWLAKVIGPRFALLAVLPEVEPPAAGAVQPAPAGESGVALLYDRRHRKNFWGSLDHALTYAAMRQLPVTVVGAPAPVEARVRDAAGNAAVMFRPRSERAAFQAWLAVSQPTVVALSLSEGVPSTLYEALIGGCTLHVLPVGGVRWLIRFAAVHTTLRVGPRTVAVIRWSSDSAAAYRAFTGSAFARLVDVITGPATLPGAPRRP